MSLETMLISHFGAVVGGGAVAALYLRHVAGWKTHFEASVGADLQHIKAILHLGSPSPVQAPPAVAIPALPQVAATAAPPLPASNLTGATMAAAAAGSPAPTLK